MSEHKPRTLVFCTAWSPDAPGTTTHWDRRYRRWLDAIQASTLAYDAILMVDDASATLPTWPGVHVVHEGQDDATLQPVTLYRFAGHLGRRAVSDFPGWVRSYLFAALFARRHGFDKVVHIESDAFLISGRVQRHVDAITEGWVAFWCPLYQRAESGIQVIAGSQLAAYVRLAEQDSGALAISVIEDTLPFTHIEKGFVGDRYGELSHEVPRYADYSMQTTPGLWVGAKEYFWWLRGQTDARPQEAVAAIERNRIAPEPPLRHNGTWYLGMLEAISRATAPRSYFEVGSRNGHSVMQFSCDSICVDPNLQLDPGVIGRKPRTFLFQLTSDDFFEREGIRRYFPAGVDVGFLDGLHLFEVLLRDFMHFEKASHRKSVALIHDCLPFNTRMASRELRHGGEDEPAGERDFWTGDVWKLVIALERYRPDLRILYLDCPPTGLVVVTNLDSDNRVLDRHYQPMVDELLGQELTEAGMERLWHLFPTLSSAQLFHNLADLRQVLGLS